MTQRDADVETRLDRIEAALGDLGDRVARIEGGKVPDIVESVPAEEAESLAPDSASSIALLGRSILILGGAYVLRALTESQILPPLAGVAGGLLYAAFWIWFADRAARGGRTAEAMFDCATAVVMAYPLLWETTTRFKLISPTSATLLALAISLLLLIVASRNTISSIGWIATVASAVMFVAIATATGATLPPMIGATCFAAVAVHVTARRGWAYVGWPAIASSDVLAFAILGGALFQSRTSFAVAGLLLYATIWLAAIPARCLVARDEPTLVEIAQVVETVLVAFVGGALIASRSVAAPALAMGMILLALMFAATRRGLPVLRATCSGLGAFGVVVGTLLLLERPNAAIVLGIVGLGAAELARRREWMLMAIHSVAWTIAAALIGGALLTLRPATYVLTALALLAYARVRGRVARIALLSVGVAGVVSIAVTLVGSTALLRTAILACCAAALGVLARLTHAREPAILARAMLVIGGIKLIAEDLRVGSAAMLVGALLIFGFATVIVARLDSPARAQRVANARESPVDVVR